MRVTILDCSRPQRVKLYDNDLASMYLNFIQLHKSSDQASQFWPSS